MHHYNSNQIDRKDSRAQRLSNSRAQRFSNSPQKLSNQVERKAQCVWSIPHEKNPKGFFGKKAIQDFSL